jgi:hypothetical protein
MDRLTQIDQLRLHVNCDLSEPCLDSLLDEVEALEAQVKAADAFLEIFRAWRHSDSTSERVRLMGRMIAASSAYTAAKEGGAEEEKPMDKPRVKPLEWEEDPRAGWKRGRVVGLSPTSKQEATIFRVEFGWQYLGDVYLTAHDNLDAALDRAKAAAQADYEARILAALEPVTVQDEDKLIAAIWAHYGDLKSAKAVLRALAERGE